MNTCGACAHHRLEGPLAAHSYGTCAVRPDPAMRAGIATSALAVCRIGLFQAKKQDDATGAPEKLQRAQQAHQTAPEGL